MNCSACSSSFNYISSISSTFTIFSCSFILIIFFFIFLLGIGKKFAITKVKGQICNPNFVGEREEGKKKLMNMVSY